MEIREATVDDIPQIVSLLRKSLGETLLPKSEKVWRYKHIDNPFGESLVLVATLKDTIVGVRAFMRWNWNIEQSNFKVFRAVDTGVLPEHQGKGVFRKLNQGAVEIAKRNGDSFIFNTPNSQSLPGNLKMGWQKIDRIKTVILPSKPFYLFLGEKTPVYSVNKKVSVDKLKGLLLEYTHLQEEKNKFYTPKTLEYLYWRYERNPLQKYQVFADEDLYLAGYLKKHKKFAELRITEHIFVNKKGLNKAKRFVKEWSKEFRCPVISFAPHFTMSPFVFSGHFGPILTFRNLNLDDNSQHKLMDLSNWEYTLGDLELF